MPMTRIETIGRWLCEECGNRFDREKSGARPIRFCSQGCYHVWNRKPGNGGGRFDPGVIPWNKGVKGIHLSPETEFKKGRPSDRNMLLGSETIRLDKNGTPRAWMKVGVPRCWRLRAVVIWERHNGPIPPGLVVHHRDHNSLNDEPENLQALTRAQHIAEHRRELAEPKMKQQSLLDGAR